MMRKSSIVAAVAVVAVSISASVVFHARASEKTADGGQRRFQLFSADGEVFKIDTTTGQVWLYSESGNTNRLHPPTECKFIEVQN